jgi:RNA polymerase sigma-70 factor (ECF subfamily)
MRPACLGERIQVLPTKGRGVRVTAVSLYVVGVGLVAALVGRGGRVERVAAVTAGRVISRLSDEDLVQRCREGNATAWNELVERFSRYVYAICGRGFGLAAEDAEDAFQEVFIRVYTRLDTLRDGGAIRPWIGQLTRRVCLDRIAASAHEVPVGEIEADALGSVLDQTIEELDEAFAVREALEELGEPCHQLLDRFFARDESYRTISEQLDLPLGTVASRISRCLEKLRRQLEGSRPVDPGSNGQ